MNFYGLYEIDNTLSLLISGCRYSDCAVSEIRDFNFGKPVTRSIEQDIIRTLKSGWRLHIHGGDLFEPENLDVALGMLTRIRKARPDIDIVVWTSHTVYDIVLMENGRAILELIDTLVIRQEGSLSPHIERSEECVAFSRKLG